LSKLAPGAERLLRARKAASKELRLPVTDWRVRRYAVLMNMHDNLTAQLAAGADVSIDGLLKLDGAMQEIRSSLPPEPLKVSVTFVDPTDAAPPGAASVDGLAECRRCHWKPEGADHVSRCYRCGWVHGADTSGPWKPLFEGKVTDGDVVKEAKPKASPKALAPPAPTEHKHPGSIHDQPGAPLKRYDEPWGVYRRTC
jgi:hypothetical protein